MVWVPPVPQRVYDGSAECLRYVCTKLSDNTTECICNNTPLNSHVVALPWWSIFVILGIGIGGFLIMKHISDKSDKKESENESEKK